MLKSYVQVAILEQQPVKTTVTQYLGIYRATPHSATGVSPAALLHGRHMRTSLDVIGHPTPTFFADPAQEMCSLRKRVKEYQRKNKVFADRRRGARVPKFQVGKYVRVKKPVPGPKGSPSFGPPLKILKRIGRWSFVLEDGHTWNASQLTAVPMEASPQHAMLDEAHSDRTAQTSVETSLPFEPCQSISPGQLQQSSQHMRHASGDGDGGDSAGGDSDGAGGDGDSAGSDSACNEPDAELPTLRRSSRNRRPPARFQDYVQ